MTTQFPNCKSLKWLIFELILFSFNQNTIGHNLVNGATSLSEIETENICNKTEYLTIDEFPENDFNEAPFPSQSFKNFLNSNINNQCKDGIVTYFNEVINLKPWALEMLDASGKLPSSFFGQTMIDYGSLEDCIKIKAISNDGAGLYTGKYCMMHLRHPLFQTPNHNPQFEKSYDQAFGVPPHWIRHDIENDLPLRFGFYGGICMPSSCTDEDLNKAISTLSEPLNLDVNLTDCQVEEPLRLPVSAILFMIFLVVLLLVCASGTILDLKDRKRKENKLKYPESLTRQVLKGFSLYTNTKELFAERVKKTSLDYLHGFRVLLCLSIIRGHIMAYPTVWKELRYRNFHFIFEFLSYLLENNGPVIVDCFITISGFLITYTLWRKIEQSKGHLNVFEQILLRYCRLTPPVLFVMSLYIVFPLISSGPIWNSSWAHEHENCYQNGWKNLLYLQNYSLMTEICMAQTWYIANTMQHAFISLPLMIVTYRYPKTGIFLGLLFYFGPSVYFFYLSLEHQFPFASYNSLRYTHLTEKFMSTVYVSSPYHLPANLIGMFAGWTCVKFGKQKLTKIWLLVGWIVSIFCFFFATALIYMPIKNFKIMAFYDSLRISGMSLATSWILYICTTGQGGIVEKALSLKSLVPLSRMSYSVYLVHPLYLVFRDAINTERYYMDRISQIGDFALYFLFSIFAGFIIYIAIEEPFNKMYDMLKKRVTSSTPPNDTTQIKNDTVLKQNGTEKR